MIKMINILVEHQSWSLNGLVFKVDHVLKTNAWIVANPIYGTLFEFPGGNAEHDDHDDNHHILKVHDHDDAYNDFQATPGVDRGNAEHEDLEAELLGRDLPRKVTYVDQHLMINMMIKVS